MREVAAMLAPNRRDFGEQPGQRFRRRQFGNVEPIGVPRLGQADRRQAVERSIELDGQTGEIDASREHRLRAANGDQGTSGKELTLNVRKWFLASIG